MTKSEFETGVTPAMLLTEPAGRDAGHECRSSLLPKLRQSPTRSRSLITESPVMRARPAAGRDDLDKPMTDLKAAFRQISVFRRHCTDPDHTVCVGVCVCVCARAAGGWGVEGGYVGRG